MIRFDGDLTRLIMRWESMTDADREQALTRYEVRGDCDYPAPEMRQGRWHLIDQPDNEANVRAQGGRG